MGDWGALLWVAALAAVALGVVWTAARMARPDTDRVTWRTSGVDGQAHVFLRFGRTYSAPLCSPTIPSNRILDAPADGRCGKCMDILTGDVPGPGPRGTSGASRQRHHPKRVATRA
jgi:hypothetical protein